MASLREFRRKIKSVKSTQQITRAMKMVAAARLRRAQGRILSARPFAQKMEEMMEDLLSRIENEHEHPLFVRRQGPRRALLLVTSDKGLCGAFNTNLIRRTISYLREHGVENVELFVAGRKGRDYFRRMGANIVKDYTGIFQNLGFVHAEMIARDLVERYQSQSLAAADLLYNEFKSVIQQRVVVKPWLPLTPVAPTIENQKSEIENVKWPDFIFEPAKEQLLEALIPRFLKAQVYRVLLESNAAELGARMAAMDNATRNADELMGELTLSLNRTRQASITKEILEVVAGAEALA